MVNDAVDYCICKAKKYVDSQNDLQTPYFINSENAYTYKKIKDRLETSLEKLYVADFCVNDDSLPDMEKLMAHMRNINKNTLLIGLGQYLSLKGEADAIKYLKIVKSLTSPKGKLVVLCYQLQNQLERLLKLDLRMRNRMELIKGEHTEKPTVTFIDESICLPYIGNTYKGMKNYLIQVEKINTGDHFVYSNKTKDDFKSSMISIFTVKDSFDALGYFYEGIAVRLVKDYGKEDQWHYLLELLHKYEKLDILLNTELGTQKHYEALFYKWRNLGDHKKWLLFIGFKLTEVKSGYVQEAVNSANCLSEFIRCIYRNILNIKHTDIQFKQAYNKRKEIIKDIDSLDEMHSFCQFSDIKERRKIYYLTDNTELERKDIIECLGKYDYSKNELDSILPVVYTELADYLSAYYFKVPFLDDYFQKYKYQKVTNRIDDGFLNVVNEHAEKREYNHELMTRIETFEKISKENATVYFVDALGVEFLGYIMAKCSKMELLAKVSICRANLPTITSCNKDFVNGTEISVKNLDKLKHDGEGDFDYRKSKLPIHIIKELEIISDLLKKVKTKLSESKKIILVSDHGASRLVVINETQYNFDVDSKGTHGGRCCKYSDNIKRIEYATEENGYYVLANYDRFKGGRAASVETHGGATLEEVVVPIIEITKQSNGIEVCFIESIISVSYKKLAELVIFASSKLTSPSVKIKDKFYNIKQLDSKKYLCPIHDIKKAGNYYADIYENNNIIAAKVKFEIRKEISNEKDLF